MQLKFPFLLLLGLYFLASCQEERTISISNKVLDSIIPQPRSVDPMNGSFALDATKRIRAEPGLLNESEYLLELTKELTSHNYKLTDDPAAEIILMLEPDMVSEEAYRLSITSKKIILAGKTPKAVFYAIQTFRQILAAQVSAGQNSEKFLLPAVTIDDAPKFNYRGMHLDVSRHFFSVEFIKKYIDILALHKMNRFHWHLTEDQGWRIEIKRYPRLSAIAAWRKGTIEGHYPGTGNDNKKYGGYYTQEQIKEIIDYASKQHITVIPEIELPGHSSAAIAAYPFLSCFPSEPTEVPHDLMSDASKRAQSSGQNKIVQESWGIYKDVYCAGKETTFEFLENVLDEVIALFPSEYIHIGGDECPKQNWERCPNCQKRIKQEGLKDEHELQSYFISRIEGYVNKQGKKIIGWDEILEGGLAPNATVMSWRGNKGGIEAAKAQHEVIMTPNSHCYFDHYQSEDKENEPLAIGGYLPVKKVYSFNPIPEELDSTNHEYIIGGQANLWTEYISTEEHAEYMLLPRLTALSEALWSTNENRDWEKFKFKLNQFRQNYDALEVNYAKHLFSENEY